MTTDEYELQFWRQYTLLEKEFLSTEAYVAIDERNFRTYSMAYGKLLLEIGSDVDIACKRLCQVINPSSTADKINKYAKDIVTSSAIPEFTSVNVKVVNSNIDNLVPWKGWTENNSPEWWQIYNKYKHQRMDFKHITCSDCYDAQGQPKKEDVPYYKLANLANVINALAGLYQLEIYNFYDVAIKQQTSYKLPMPGSRLFELKDDPSNPGSKWDNEQFATDVALQQVDDTLKIIMGKFQY